MPLLGTCCRVHAFTRCCCCVSGQILHGGLACCQEVGAGSRVEGLPLQQRSRLIESPLPGHARLAFACSIVPKHSQYRDADSSHCCIQRSNTRDARPLHLIDPYLPSFVACLMTSTRSPTRSEATSSSRKSASKSRRSQLTLCSFAKVAAAMLWAPACRSRPQPPPHSMLITSILLREGPIHGMKRLSAHKAKCLWRCWCSQTMLTPVSCRERTGLWQAPCCACWAVYISSL